MDEETVPKTVTPKGVQGSIPWLSANPALDNESGGLRER